jgi:hypothetical protein
MYVYRMESGHMDEVKPFDWTFTTDYSGTLTGNFAIKSRPSLKLAGGGGGGAFTGSRPGREAVHSTPTSVKVKKI